MFVISRLSTASYTLKVFLKRTDFWEGISKKNKLLEGISKKNRLLGRCF